jgi:hypothetical protein
MFSSVVPDREVNRPSQVSVGSVNSTDPLETHADRRNSKELKALQFVQKVRSRFSSGKLNLVRKIAQFVFFNVLLQLYDIGTDFAFYRTIRGNSVIKVFFLIFAVIGSCMFLCDMVYFLRNRDEFFGSAVNPERFAVPDVVPGAGLSYDNPMDEEQYDQILRANRSASTERRQAQIKLMTIFLEDTPQLALAIAYIYSQKDASGAGGLNLPNEIWLSMAGSIFNLSFALYKFCSNRAKAAKAFGKFGETDALRSQYVRNKHGIAFRRYPHRGFSV